MSYIIAGLGNPGEEYVGTRHNTGRMIVDTLNKEFGEGDFSYNKTVDALVAKGEVSPSADSKVAKSKRDKVTFVEPEDFMNNSGKAIAKLVKSVKAAEKLIVIYDDFNLPLGKIRISYNRSSGGHNGLESVIKAVKTEAFTRIRIGVAPETAKGLAKVPHGDDKVLKFILGPYKDDEMKEIKKITKDVVEAVKVIVFDGREKAMSMFNH